MADEKQWHTYKVPGGLQPPGPITIPLSERQCARPVFQRAGEKMAFVHDEPRPATTIITARRRGEDEGDDIEVALCDECAARVRPAPEDLSISATVVIE